MQAQLERWPPAAAVRRHLMLVARDDADFEASLRDILRVAAPAQPRHFDEAFYLAHNPDVFTAVRTGMLASGLHHFIGWGVFEGRMPCADWAQRAATSAHTGPAAVFDAAAYAREHPEAAAFLAEFPQLEPAKFAALYGRALGHFADCATASSDADAVPPAIAELMRPYFDPDFYRHRHMAGTPDADPFRHFLRHGLRVGHSPSAAFDEAFYRALYPDVSDAIAAGRISSGFEHYLRAGQREARLPRHDPVRTLEILHPGVAQPHALNSLGVVSDKLEPCAYEASGDPNAPRLWIMLPFLIPDLMFGGFASLLAFTEALLARGIRLGLFLRDAPATQAQLFQHQMNGASRFARALAQMPVFSPRDGKPFGFGPRDVFLAFSTWEGLWSRRFAAATQWRRPIFWIQEYEPVFHAYNTVHFLSNSAYHYDHVGVFNSAFLRTWFRTQGIGLYGAADAREAHSMAFEHLLWQPRKAGHARAGGDRTLLVYARPENHAGRNVFEIAVHCLRVAASRGAFTGTWRMIGLGALGGPYRVPIGDGLELDVQPRMPADEYADVLATVDVGLSLMWAPHPSLLPFEMARSGAVVVTNTFPGRDVNYIAGRSRNIIACEPTVDAIADALQQATQRASAPRSRRRERSAAPFPDTRTASWFDVFDDAFMARLAECIGHGFAWSMLQEGTAATSQPGKGRA